MTSKTKCLRCGSDDLFFAKQWAAEIQISFWKGLRSQVRICKACGQIDEYLSEKQLTYMREKFPGTDRPA